VPAAITRKSLLARGGVAVLAASVPAALRPARAGAAAPPDNDLAYARLLVAVELLSADFYARALAAKHFGRAPTDDLKRALADEKRHYDSVAAILADAGQTPATADDIDFTYPRGAFASKGSISRLGVKIEHIALGAYLGAVGGYQTDALKLPAAQIAANEAQHLGVFTALAQGRRIGPAFAAPLAIDHASDALDAYTS
jgi:ferritin-like protein